MLAPPSFPLAPPPVPLVCFCFLWVKNGTSCVQTTEGNEGTNLCVGFCSAKLLWPGLARPPGGGGFAHCKDEWRCGVTAGKVPMETAASQKSPFPPSGWARMFGSFQTVSV